jgi:hypothetical protein
MGMSAPRREYVMGVRYGHWLKTEVGWGQLDDGEQGGGCSKFA